MPGFNSDQAEGIAKIAAELKNLTGVRVLAYHKYAGSKYSSLGMNDSLPQITPTEKELSEARGGISRYGVKVIE